MPVCQAGYQAYSRYIRIQSACLTTLAEANDGSIANSIETKDGARFAATETVNLCSSLALRNLFLLVDMFVCRKR